MILLICSFYSHGQNSTDIPCVIENLISSGWSTVYKAKDTLEMHAFKALPYLIELLDELIKGVFLEKNIVKDYRREYLKWLDRKCSYEDYL